MTLTHPVLILLLGIQGSGKGTQAALLAEQFRIPHVVAGDMFRNVAMEKTPLGVSVAENLRQGKIMSIDQWENVVGRYVATNDLAEGAVLDGVLRSLEQVDRFQRIATEQQLPRLVAVFLKLDEATALVRLEKRGRADDRPEQLRERFAWSRQEMMPVVEYYRNHGQLIEVDGNQSIASVHQAILNALEAAGIART